MKRNKSLLPNRHIYEEGKTYFCECPCCAEIKIKAYHKSTGVPRYLPGHNQTKIKTEPEGFKKCTKCHDVKKLSEFNKQTKSNNGYQAYCKECNYVYNSNYLESKDSDWKENNRKNKRLVEKQWREDNPDKHKSKMILHRYNITLDQVNQMKFDQDWCCKICGLNESDLLEMTSKGLCVDHDHKTGEIRGLLCIKCNSLLGNSGDSPLVLKSAINYLNEFKEK